MENLYNVNGLVFWTEEEILLRKMFEEYFTKKLFFSCLSQNQAFKIFQIEAPILTPKQLINPNYTSDDIYNIDDLVLRPETTMGCFEYARHLLENHHKDLKIKAPIIVWQHGKSFRKEQDLPTKYMRLKEFYQLEYQIIYGLTTANDYSIKIIEDTRKFISDMIGECNIQESDRLPSYSESTMDIICNDMEVCSISKRKDFSGYKVLEVSVGTDRCIFNFLKKP